jgi:hypothetical protein
VMTRFSLSVGPITAGFSQKPAVMSWEALSLSVFKNPAVMRLAVKTKSIVVYVRSALCKELAYHSLF